MSDREQIQLAGRTTNVHVAPLSPSDAILLAPATHKGVCIFIPGVQSGMQFVYAGAHYKVLKAWDDAVASSGGADQNAKGVRQARDLQEVAYRRTRIGKFLDMLLVQASGEA